MRMEGASKGEVAGAHSGSNRGGDEAGDASKVAQGRRGSGRPEVEDEIGEVVQGLPVPRGSAERARTMRRSFWTDRGDEGEAMAAVVLVGGGGRIR